MLKERHHYHHNECQFVKGPYAGQKRYYLDALMACLHDLQPKRCLEIGTHTGNSTEVFKEYFRTRMSYGLLITCDIKKYSDSIESLNVKFVQVHPHVKNSSDWHNVEESELLEYDDMSIYTNGRLILETSGTTFDFIFIDGDHQWESIHRDYEMSKALIEDDGFILLDDISEFEHESARYFEEIVKNDPDVSYWEFDKNWNGKTGAALVWRKENEVARNWLNI